MLLVDNALRHSVPPTVSRRMVSSSNRPLSVKMITTVRATHTHIVSPSVQYDGVAASFVTSSSAQSVKRITTIPTPLTGDFSPSNAKKFIAFRINISVCKIVQSLNFMLTLSSIAITSRISIRKWEFLRNIRLSSKSYKSSFKWVKTKLLKHG